MYLTNIIGPNTPYGGQIISVTEDMAITCFPGLIVLQPDQSNHEITLPNFSSGTQITLINDSEFHLNVNLDETNKVKLRKQDKFSLFKLDEIRWFVMDEESDWFDDKSGREQSNYFVFDPKKLGDEGNYLCCKIDETRYLICLTQNNTYYTTHNVVFVAIARIEGQSIKFSKRFMADTNSFAAALMLYGCKMLDATRFMITWWEDPQYTDTVQKAVIGDVGDDSITFGSVFITADEFIEPLGEIAVLSPSSVATIYTDNIGNLTIALLTVTGSVITYGNQFICKADSAGDLCYGTMVALDSTHLAIVYHDNDERMTVIGTVTGSSITFGTEVEFETNDLLYSSVKVVDLDSSNYAIMWAFDDDYSNAYIVIASTDDTTISLGTSQLVSDRHISHVYLDKIDSENLLLAFNEIWGNGDVKLCYCYATVNGNVIDIDFDSKTRVDNQPSNFNNANPIALSDTKQVINFNGYFGNTNLLIDKE